MKVYRFCLLALCLFVGTAFAATVSSPLTILKSTSSQLISTLHKEKASLKNNPQVVYDITRKILLPHADLQRMARSVVDRGVWAKATVAQRDAFTVQFTSLLVHTYAAALAAYNDQDIQFSPIRGDYSKQQSVEVNSQIVARGKPNINIGYRLIRDGNDWKVYDLSVEGISLLQSFRSQFAQVAQQGIVKLTERLAQHNAKADNRS